MLIIMALSNFVPLLNSFIAKKKDDVVDVVIN